jgi:tetratricopeptide (TPR) repeat protein
MVEYITLLNLTGKYDEALTLLQSRKFHPWEGGEGKVTGQYVFTLTAKARLALHKNASENAPENAPDNAPEQALSYLQQARHYPDNLGEGKLQGALENALDYWSGVACDQMKRHEEAKAYWIKATQGLQEPYMALYYNDQPPDTLFYQGLAHRALGNTSAADERFRTLLDFGRRHENDAVRMDYFAVSLPDLQIWDDDLNLRHRIQCRYLMGLGYAGLGEADAASAYLRQVLADDRSHPGAIALKEMINTTFVGS